MSDQHTSVANTAPVYEHVIRPVGPRRTQTPVRPHHGTERYKNISTVAEIV